MTSRIHPTLKHVHSNQENARIKAKTVANSNVPAMQPVKRGALGDLGNTLLRNHNEPSKNIIPITKKNADLVKKPPTINKENVVKKSVINKENNVIIARDKIVPRKPIRQESVFIKQPLVQVPHKTTTVPKTTKLETPKEVVIYDPDKEDREDPLMVAEYTADILSYLYDIENKYPIKAKFLEDVQVTSKMRSTLVNWLVDAHMNFSLELDTLYLCITIIDRYLQVNKAVDRHVYQLVGATALLLACKFEELYVPEVSDFEFICDNAFDKGQILKMEIDIVSKLDFRLGWPLPIYFLRRYSKVAKVKSDQYNLAKYILELGLLEYNIAHVKPSIQAAAACCLGIAIINEVLDASKVWTPTLAHYTTYHYSDFKQVVYDYAEIIAKAETSKFDSVKQKYSSSKFGKISLNFRLNGPLVRKMTLSPSYK